jgi:hypothetical protein
MKTLPGIARSLVASSCVNSEHPVGQKSRRARDVFLPKRYRAGFEPCVRVASSRGSSFPAVRNGGRWDIHGTAQIRRGPTVARGFTMGAPRFSPHRMLGDPKP